MLLFEGEPMITHDFVSFYECVVACLTSFLCLRSFLCLNPNCFLKVSYGYALPLILIYLLHQISRQSIIVDLVVSWAALASVQASWEKACANLSPRCGRASNICCVAEMFSTMLMTARDIGTALAQHVDWTWY